MLRDDQKKTRISVLIADDHRQFLDAVHGLLRTKFHVVGTVTNGADLIREAVRLNPDVIVSDISMPDLSGIEACSRLRARGIRSKFILLSIAAPLEFVEASKKAGSDGFVLKTRIGTDLVLAIEASLAPIPLNH